MTTTPTFHAPEIGEIRVPPHADEAERGLLGAILMDNAVLRAVSTQPEHMYREPHRIILRAMRDMEARGEVVDVLTLGEHLRTTHRLDAAGGMNQLARLSRDTPSTVHATSYAAIVQERARQRARIAALTAQVDALYSGVQDMGELDEALQRHLLDSSAHAGSMTHIRTAISAQAQELEARFKGTIPPALKTGLADLDDITNGWERGDLVILGARPGMGKTAVALDLALRFAFGEAADAVPVGVFSLEMTEEQLAMRMACSLSGIDSGRMQRAEFRERDWAPYIDAVGSLMEAPIYIDDTAALPITELCSRARRAVMEHGLRVIFVDYLQLVRAPGKRSEQEVVSEVSRQLKALAKDTGTTVVALAQLNRGVEQREDKRPRTHDLRESGQLEQDADQIIMLYRDEVYNEDTSDSGTIELLLRKNRRGRVGVARMRWDGTTYKISSF